MKIIFFTFIVFLSLNGIAKSVDRQMAEGYFAMDSQKRIFFLKKRGVLDSGIRVKFKNLKAQSTVCFLSKPLRLDCPLQTISFAPKQEFGHLVMDKAQLIGGSTAWHKLRSAEMIFGIQRKPSQKK
ncbi:MAG: hypothetical protein AB7F59_12265 [Bdellovibrionales bacterium]